MGHHHQHHHGHEHGHIDLKGRNLLLSILLNICITAAEVVGGIISGSLALLSDALHNFSDVLSLIISYVATQLAKRKASADRTFGYKRAEILAAFINASTLVIVAVFLMIEAVKRLLNPEEISSNLVIFMSLIGIVANGLSVLLLKKDSNENMNMKSAYLHLLTDMMASVAVLVGGILMKFFQMYWVDAVLTMAIGVYLIYMGYDLLKESTKVLMLFTPKSIEVREIVNFICELDAVKNVHHVHIWQLNEEEIHMEAHIDFKKDIRLSEFDGVLNTIEAHVYEHHGINHVNIQPEYNKTDSKNIIVQD